MKVLILICVIVLARGQAEFPCCVPDAEWEADEGLMIGSSTGDVQSLSMGTFKLSFDNDKRMVNTEGILWTNSHPAYIRILQDFNKGQQFMVTGTNCAVTPLPYSFIPSCVPANATKLPSAYYGLPNDPIHVDMYTTKLFGMDMIMSVTPVGDPSEKKCLPMGQVFYGTVGGTGKLMNVGFTNYTSGVRTRGVFDEPHHCSSNVHV